jgi:hypothetical protein
MNSAKEKKLKRIMEAVMSYPPNYCGVTTSGGSLADLPYKAPPRPYEGQCIKEEGINPMCYGAKTAAIQTGAISITTEAGINLEAQTREYLLGRLQIAKSVKRNELYKTFNYYKTKGPKNWTQAIELLKAGKFKLTKEGEKRLKKEATLSEDDICPFYAENFESYIEFEGLTDQPDYDGFRKADDEMDAQILAIKDIIMVGTATDALKAIQAFADWKPSNQPA